VGNSAAATKKCRDEMAQGRIALIFPASNGIEWMEIYAHAKILRPLLEMGRDGCQKHFSDPR
jgi:hypothetical protein